MTALRTIVGVCNRYVKALKKKLTGKRDVVGHRRRPRVFRGPTAIGTDNCYDNEAADNVINEFLENGKRKR